MYISKNNPNRRTDRCRLVLFLVLLPVALAALGWGIIPAANAAACKSLIRNHTGEGDNPLADPIKSDGCNNPYRYEPGEEITLTAEPADGWQVATWDGTDNDDSLDKTNTVTMPNAAHTVSVNYEPIPLACYALTLEHTGNGADPTAEPAHSEGCDPGKYTAGQAISLTAKPDDDWQVANWSGTDNDDSTESNNTVIMPATDYAVIVTYELIPVDCYALTLVHTGNGADPTAEPSNSTGCDAGNYIGGETITVTAAPIDNWRVKSWSGTTNDSSTSITNMFIMPAGVHSVSVTYEPIPVTCYALIRAHEGNGTDPVALPPNSIDCGAGNYIEGESITVTAAPEEGWRVKSWNGTTNDSSTSITNIVIMPDGPHSVNVTYENVPPQCFALARTHTGSGSDPVAAPPNSTGCDAGKYIEGESITVTAAPDEGWRVKSWSGTTNDRSTSITNNITMPAEALTVRVTYVEIENEFRVMIPVIYKEWPSWIRIGAPEETEDLYTATACPEDPTIRYAGGRNDFYRWDDNKWALFSGAPANVRDILFPANDCDGAYMASYKSGVMKLSGTDWKQVGPTELPTARSLVRRGDHLYLAAQSGLYRRAEAAAPNDPWAAINDVQDFTRLSQAGDRIYAAVFGQGVWYNDACAAPLQTSCRWAPMETPPFADAFDVVGSESGSPPEWTIMATARGLYRWDGTKWSRPEQPPEPLGYVFALAQVDGLIYAGLQNGGVWVSADMGETWYPRPINNAQNNTIIDLVVVPGDGIYATTPNNGVYRWPFR